MILLNSHLFRSFPKLEGRKSIRDSFIKSSRNKIISKAASNWSNKMVLHKPPKASKIKRRYAICIFSFYRNNESFMQKCTKRISQKSASFHKDCWENPNVSRRKISNQRLKAVERVTLELNSPSAQDDCNETIMISGPSLCHKIVSDRREDLDLDLLSNILGQEQYSDMLNYETLYDVPNEDYQETLLQRSLPK